MSDAAPAGLRALLDTTLQVDRKKMPARKERIDELLAPYGYTLTTSISLLEFKATVIQECIFIHDELRKPKARFTRVRDEVLESQHRQAKLRAHIFNNLICVFAAGPAEEVSEADDRRLAEKARLALENAIPVLYKWFVEEAGDSLLKDRVGCTRAEEAPRKAKRAFATNLPICKRGKNKSCRVEEAIREAAPAVRAGLQAAGEEADKEKEKAGDQLRKALKVIDGVVGNAAADLSHGDCRNAGDFLIGLEGRGCATHAFSTNRRDWRHIAPLFGMEFVHVTYPKGGDDEE